MAVPFFLLDFSMDLRPCPHGGEPQHFDLLFGTKGRSGSIGDRFSNDFLPAVVVDTHDTAAGTRPDLGVPLCEFNGCGVPKFSDFIPTPTAVKLTLAGIGFPIR